MATEEGIVTKISKVKSKAWVKTKKSGACESCSSRNSCNVMGGGNEAEVEVINSAEAGVGDRVVINFKTSSLMKATFLLYVFPIICMFAGAFAGQEFAHYFSFSPNGFSMVLGFLFFGLSILFVKSKGNMMAKEEEYQPEIIRIKKKASLIEEKNLEDPA